MWILFWHDIDIAPEKDRLCGAIPLLRHYGVKRRRRAGGVNLPHSQNLFPRWGGRDDSPPVDGDEDSRQ
jgi:hypothetical protein